MRRMSRFPQTAACSCMQGRAEKIHRAWRARVLQNATTRQKVLIFFPGRRPPLLPVRPRLSVNHLSACSRALVILPVAISSVLRRSCQPGPSTFLMTSFLHSCSVAPCSLSSAALFTVQLPRSSHLNNRTFRSFRYSSLLRDHELQYRFYLALQIFPLTRLI